MLENKNKISIIVPIYNVEKYISKCLDSIMNQTYSNLEIILVNDGSSDNSGQLCEKYKAQDSRIKLICQDNQGLSMARNNGLDIATGEYIGFVDSDDWIENDMFELLLANILKCEADISMCQYLRLAEDELYKEQPSINNIKILANTKDIIKHNLIYYGNEGRINCGVWNKLYKRNLFDKVRFIPGKINEDVIATYQLLNYTNRMVISSDYKYIYLCRENSITTRPMSKNTFDLIDAYLNIYEDVRLKYEEFEPLCRKLLLSNITGIFSRISQEKTQEQYQEQINKMIDIIKSQDIYSCGLAKWQVIAIRMYINKYNDI